MITIPDYLKNDLKGIARNYDDKKVEEIVNERCKIIGASYSLNGVKLIDKRGKKLTSHLFEVAHDLDIYISVYYDKTGGDE